jgi:hypothetical protein
MRIRFTILGFVVLLLPTLSQAERGTNLYQKVLQITEFEFSFDRSEGPVEKFVSEIAPEDAVKLKESDIGPALQEWLKHSCSEAEVYEEDCNKVIRFVREAVTKAEQVRSLGRDLQTIALSYELPIHPHPNLGLSITTKMPSISHIWQSDNDSLLSPIVEQPLTLEPLKWEDVQSEVSAVQSAFGALSGEQLTAAVWRYQYGVEQVKKEKEGTNDCSSKDEKPDGTELQYTKTRWCKLEKALDKLQKRAIEIANLPELNTKRIFPTFPVGDAIVWIRSDDVGLAWKMPTEPVLPSLDCSKSDGKAEECQDGVILGGTYPDPPESPEANTKLCSSPISNRGYLCRALESEECNSKRSEGGDTGIVLTRCQVPEFEKDQTIAIKESGPNICSVGGWRSDTGKDIPDSCTRCTIALSCGGCEGGFGGSVSWQGGGDRVLSVCTAAEGDIPPSYFTLARLTEAQARCHLSEEEPFVDRKETCCAREWEPALVFCNALAEDGNFLGTDITVEGCAAIVTGERCEGQGFDSCLQEDLEYDWEAIAEAASKNRGEVPSECIADKERLSERAESVLHSLPLACEPGCASQYHNTIGNNLCFSGQCVEQSLEEHRLIPGRETFVDQGESFPWDSCSAPDPAHEQINLTLLPPQHITQFPSYNPAELVHSMDIALCQLNGLPALTPPVLCSFDVRRRFRFPQPEFTRVAESLVNQTEESALPSYYLQRLAPSVGTRVGTSLYVSYLQPATKSFKDLTDLATSLLEHISQTSFPATMCPAKSDSNICNSLKRTP